MTLKVGINGLGRIGRLVLRTILERYPDKLEVVAINHRYDMGLNAHLLKYDSNYGRFNGTLTVDGEHYLVNGKKVRSFPNKAPDEIPWKDAGVEIVIEATGAYTDADKARGHLKGGAKKVIITAPAKNEDLTVVIGVNDDKYDPARHVVISNASCTTNGLAPPVSVVHSHFGIERGFMNTVHSYTNDQKVLDKPHPDYRRARAAALNMIPTSTGAARALALVIPELKGKFDGLSLRVPTPTVSIVDFTCTLSKSATLDEVKAALKAAAAEGKLKGVMGYDEENLVSVDYKGCALSSVVDGPFTQLIGGNLLKVLAWYDNEWAYCCRVADLAAIVADRGL
ncbi:MAG: type I glyceraldehyde-3-phosphate dehydrogenase [Deltaproteobacteria bacterium]|jgi:glyceraldehyde 3-phosphate dehydrogenase|nr:type I glyceraldehyde-3-phosphate dehydrogenase [Deltaproteobacteria bacterium]